MKTIYLMFAVSAIFILSACSGSISHEFYKDDNFKTHESGVIKSETFHGEFTEIRQWIKETYLNNGYGYMTLKNSGIQLNGLITPGLGSISEGMVINKNNRIMYYGNFYIRDNSAIPAINDYAIIKKTGGKVELIKSERGKILVLNPKYQGKTWIANDSLFVVQEITQKNEKDQLGIVYNLRTKPLNSDNAWGFYQGRLKNQRATGMGVQYFWDGRFYFGQFLNGKKEGYGILFDKGDPVKVGVWKNDRYIKFRPLFFSSFPRKLNSMGYQSKFVQKYIPGFETPRDFAQYAYLSKNYSGDLNKNELLGFKRKMSEDNEEKDLRAYRNRLMKQRFLAEEARRYKPQTPITENIPTYEQSENWKESMSDEGFELVDNGKMNFYTRDPYMKDEIKTKFYAKADHEYRIVLIYPRLINGKHFGRVRLKGNRPARCDLSYGEASVFEGDDVVLEPRGNESGSFDKFGHKVIYFKFKQGDDYCYPGSYTVEFTAKVDDPDMAAYYLIFESK